jgi:Fic family protein
MNGDWEEWIHFFLRGVRDTAETASTTAQKLLALAARDADRIQKFGRAAGSALRVHQSLQHRPITTIAATSKATGLSIPTVTKALETLRQAGIVQTTPRFRNRTFAYSAYLSALNE